MKRRKQEPLAVLAFEKEVTLRPEDVPAIAHERIAKLITTFGSDAEPLRILLGPNEWLLLCEFERNHPYAFPGYDNHGRTQISLRPPGTLLGYPVGLKQSPGIEFEFNPRMATVFAMGAIK